MASNLNSEMTTPDDPRFALKPAELVADLMTGRLVIDLAAYPDADGGRVPITLIGVDDEDVFDLTTGKGCDQAIGRVLEAQRESRRISERVKLERRKAREKGIPGPGMPAFGWQDKYSHDEMQAEV